MSIVVAKSRGCEDDNQDDPGESDIPEPDPDLPLVPPAAEPIPLLPTTPAPVPRMETSRLSSLFRKAHTSMPPTERPHPAMTIPFKTPVLAMPLETPVFPKDPKAALLQ
ncbi:hypothetical protein COCC4DRAFT_181643 [Bipolaris maydis ATCC 48331]|uniref:Uncharacterized protein n=2 Tax=Cochliobolus heterostrophus TaxID=5016 RepID=M2UKQ0_COCH5|nr:uncharacterized protein COCC4DRAFT_181643 [Bipolaris maydis ATCC 48331]EMD88522.1 hypothetical protein COCHEDRAFT_1226707 [Bipolaris maydis C5]ENH99161.1 hypothetical protein COCC4DRAFT_181643 [Bipolaris maydis ATCC 48331]KAH7556795.1 hypothetical protein BM1_06229 [Bipolaris maydis]KAJ6205469.1 hypothetical protein PSV09DRAFT_1226707 [Bipolaris maydis]